MARFRMAEIFFLSLIFIVSAHGTMDSVRSTIEHIVDDADGRIGVAVIDIDTGDTLTVNGNDTYPMQSVYKFHLALAVLKKVDMGELSLDQRIHVLRSDLLPNTWSPLREKYPEGDVDITLDELIATTVSWSDNNGCDILFRLIGGPKKVNEFIHRAGIEKTSIISTEQEMHADSTLQYRNWSSPYAMASLLEKFYNKKILSATSTEYLWKILVDTQTGANRIKGKLPEGSVVGHKTGSSGTDANGMAAATNDVGIVVLPNGSQFIIAVFLSDSKARSEIRDEVIADIAKTVADYFMIKN